MIRMFGDLSGRKQNGGYMANSIFGFLKKKETSVVNAPVEENVPVTMSESDYEKKLEDAIKNGDFELFYQPVVEIESGDEVSAEAFARFADGNGGYEDTTAMIELAKKNGSIIKLSDLVLKRVCEFIQTGILDDKDISYIQINMSVNDWNDPNMFERVTSIVKDYEIGASQIMLELTEDCISDSMDVVLKNVEEFHRVGFRLAMDNFGAANTNVAQMLHMPLDMIKIDKELIEKAHLSSHSMEILSEMVKMFQKFGLGMVAECVENVGQSNMMLDMGCTQGQGNYYAMPMSQSDFAKVIK